MDVRIDLQECSSLTLTRVLRANPVECIIVELSCSGPNIFAILNIPMKWRRISENIFNGHEQYTVQINFVCYLVIYFRNTLMKFRK